MSKEAKGGVEIGELPSEAAGLLLELASEAIMLTDSQLRILGVNGQTCMMLGYSKAELVGRDVISFIPDDDLWIVPGMRETLARGDTGRGQHKMRRKDGSMVMAEFSARKIPDGNGNILGIVRDVSERARAEANLRRHKDFIEQLLECSSDGICAFDTEMTVMLFNPAMERITGLPSSEVVGRKVFDVFPFLLDMEEDKLMNAALHGQKTEARDRTFVIPQSGREGRYEARYSPLTDHSGIIVGAIGIIRDVTERYALEQRLLHAQKMETAGRLAGGIAHDFNNVLTVILGEVALHSGARYNADKAREALRRIGESAERAASITRQLLAFSRRNFVSPSVFTLNDLVDGLRPMLQHLVGEGIRLNIVRGASQSVKADRGQVEQVLANLIVNARDAMPGGGTLTIETHTESVGSPNEWRLGSITSGDYAVVTVGDTGHGMSDDVQKKLFEPFFTTKPNGTGLGLCTCLAMLQANGGDISVKSSPGRGTVIRVCLPQASSLSRSFSSAAPLDSQELPLGSESILLVEDEGAVGVVTAEMLRALGYTVYQSDNGAAALAFLEACEDNIDLVLTDVVMPLIGGRELMDRIRVMRPKSRILLMTGYMEDNALRRRVQDEGLPILEKPFTHAALAAKVRSVLDARTPFSRDTD